MHDKDKVSPFVRPDIWECMHPLRRETAHVSPGPRFHVVTCLDRFSSTKTWYHGNVTHVEWAPLSSPTSLALRLRGRPYGPGAPRQPHFHTGLCVHSYPPGIHSCLRHKYLISALQPYNTSYHTTSQSLRHLRSDVDVFMSIMYCHTRS